MAGVDENLAKSGRCRGRHHNFFSEFLEGHRVTRSMSRPGKPYDNAPMERWWNEFKLWWLDRLPMAKTYFELVRLIEEVIRYFNHLNPSAQRNGMTPDEYWEIGKQEITARIFM